MLIKKKPITPGQRHQVKLVQNLFLKKSRLKYYTLKVKKLAGRNNTGKITVFHRGGGAKRKILRKIFLPYNGFEGIVVGIEKDPNRTALLARVFDIKQNFFCYVIATKNTTVGTTIKAGFDHYSVRTGNRLPLKQIPAGSIVSLVGAKNRFIASAAGTSCQVLQKNNFIAKIRVPSGKIIFIDSNILSTLGAVSNEKKSLQTFGNAGYFRHKGFRPIVRGVAKNPVDHPHGGGGGKPSVTPWGKPTKGKPTKKNKI